MSHCTKQQIVILSEFMEKHPELAKSYNAASSSGRVTQRQLWEKLARNLNSNGPPTKTVAEWKRVWALRMYSTKKKLTYNKKSLKQTGGGPFDMKPLDETEEAIIKACGMEASVSGVEGGLAFGSSAQEKNDQELDDTIDQLLQELDGTLDPLDPEIMKEKTNIPPPSKKNTKQQPEDEILKKQIDLQEKFFSSQMQSANKINSTLVEIRDAIRELCAIRKNENGVAHDLKKQELEIRRKELEVAKLANEIKIMQINSQPKLIKCINFV